MGLLRRRTRDIGSVVTWALLWVGLGVTACGTPREPDSATEPTSSVSAATSEGGTTPSSLATSSTGSAPPAAETVATNAAPRSVEARFAPIDTRCKLDADCAVTMRGISEPLFCCDGCDAVAGAKAWVARADEACKAYSAGVERHPCPPRDCMPLGPARCHLGHCELTPTRP